MDEARKNILWLMLLMVIAGCGGNPPLHRGGLAITISGAKSFNPNIEPGSITRYQVTVTGEGIAEPIVAEFPGDATEGVIEGVPTGEGRIVAVTAHNPNDATIRAGEAYGVAVDGDLTEVAVAMESVPIFTNIAEDATVDNTRLVFKVFADPAHPVAIEERGGTEKRALVDASTSNPHVQLDASTGLGRMAPLFLAPGARRFAVVDLATGRESEAKVLVVDGTGRKPAPIVAAGLVAPQVSVSAGPRF